MLGFTGTRARTTTFDDEARGVMGSRVDGFQDVLAGNHDRHRGVTGDTRARGACESRAGIATRAPRAGSVLARMLVVCVAAFASASCERTPARATRPNVLVITLDTTRADALGSVAQDPTRTPNLDALAAEGARFDLAIATAALTPVSHASIFTGRDNARHGLRVLCAPSGARLPADVPTLATILGEHGWRTLAVFSAFPVSDTFGFARGFATFDGPSGAFEDAPNGHPTWHQDTLQRRADATTDRALEQLSASRDPFCLWVHYWDPHEGAPEPPPEFVGAEFPRDENGRLVRTRRLYAAEVRFVDREIGRLLDALRRGGRYEDTIVVVVGDHGEGLGDHGWGDHRILYQEQIRVPLVVRVPGPIRAHVVDALVRTTDVLPTVLDYAGLPPPVGADGRSLRPLLEGTADERRIAFADALNGYDLNVSTLAARPQDDFAYAVIDAPWKLVYRPLHPEAHELFDLARDPGELVNRFGHEPEVETRLLTTLARHGGFVTRPFVDASASAHDAARVSRQLSHLGYAQGEIAGRDARFAWRCVAHGTRPAGESSVCSVCREPLLPVRAAGRASR